MHRRPVRHAGRPRSCECGGLAEVDHAGTSGAPRSGPNGGSPSCSSISACSLEDRAAQRGHPADLAKTPGLKGAPGQPGDPTVGLTGHERSTGPPVRRHEQRAGLAGPQPAATDVCSWTSRSRQWTPRSGRCWEDLLALRDRLRQTIVSSPTASTRPSPWGPMSWAARPGHIVRDVLVRSNSPALSPRSGGRR